MRTILHGPRLPGKTSFSAWEKNYLIILRIYIIFLQKRFFLYQVVEKVLFDSIIRPPRERP
jgi:hypothetical protein